MSIVMTDRNAGPEIRIDAYLLQQICAAECADADAVVRFRGAAYDSRHVQPGNLFVALRGERTDGHRYLDQAVSRGAAVCLVEKDHPALAHFRAPVPLVRVPDTKVALGDLAEWQRNRFELPLVAVTGSNGKTTTKEMIAAVLGARYSVFKTPGNLNSLIGVPISLFDLEPQHEVGVCELGMSTPGEIDRLGRMIRPRLAVFTNIAPAHLESLGTIEAVAAAKFELLRWVPEDGMLFFCADDPLLMAEAEARGPRSRTFGLQADADLRADNVRTDSDGVRFQLESGEDVFLPLFGRHNVYNALAALLVARTLHVDTLAAVAALATMAPAQRRSRILTLGTITVIDDTYNANPRATVAAAESLLAYPTRGRRVAVLGDMLELGAQAQTLHREVGRRVRDLRPDLLITVGALAETLGAAACEAAGNEVPWQHFATAELCAQAIQDWCRPNDVILLKGSRGVALEQVTTALTRVFGEHVKEEP